LTRPFAQLFQGLLHALRLRGGGFFGQLLFPLQLLDLLPQRFQIIVRAVVDHGAVPSTAQ